MQEVNIAVTRILLNQRIYPYNTKLILSCLKQTLALTLKLVTQTGTITPGEADRAEEALAAKATVVKEAITETVQLLNNLD